MAYRGMVAFKEGLLEHLVHPKGVKAVLIMLLLQPVPSSH